jgi:hypothetical protein
MKVVRPGDLETAAGEEYRETTCALVVNTGEQVTTDAEAERAVAPTLGLPSGDVRPVMAEQEAEEEAAEGLAAKTEGMLLSPSSARGSLGIWKQASVVSTVSLKVGALAWLSASLDGKGLSLKLSLRTAESCL